MPRSVSYALLLLSIRSLAATYTLDQAIEIALANNPELKAAQETLKDAEAKVNEAYGNAWPTVSLSGKYERAFDQYSAFGSASANSNPFVNSAPFLDPNSPNFNLPTAALARDLGNMLDFSSLTKDYTTAIQLEVKQILFAQGKISTGVEIAKLYTKLTRSSVDVQKRKIRSDIAQSFHQVLYFSAAVDLYRQSIEQARNHLTSAETALANGMTSELTVHRARLHVQDLEAGLDKMEKDLRTAKNALLLQMGLPWDPDVEFIGSLSEPTSLELPDTSLAEALNRRGEIHQLQASEEIQKQLITIAKADYYPLLVAGATAGWISTSNGAVDFDFQPDQRVYLAFQMNLFNGFQTREKITQARTEVNKVRIRREDAERGIRLQIESETVALLDAYRRVNLRRETITLAEKTLQMTETAYQSGRASQLEYLDASLAARKARLEYLAALQDYHNARIRLAVATGNF